MVSLESAERPNYFLVVSEHGRLRMERWSRGAEFGRRATFIQHQGLFLPGHTSFELVGQPGIFLTLTRTAAQARRYDPSDGFRISSSFTLEGRETHACQHTQVHHRGWSEQIIRFLSSAPDREQFCDSTPFDVRVALPGMRESLCADVQ